MGNWSRVTGKNLKSHAVPTVLAAMLAADMHCRGTEDLKVEDNSHGFSYDLGGMCFADRPVFVFNFKHTRITVPADELPGLYNTVKHAGLRVFSRPSETTDFQYLKLHGMYECLVIDAADRDELLAKIEPLIEPAFAASRAFYAQKNQETAELRAQQARAN